ncbi:MAG: M20/M25/M40 family metallo-hydrolase [Bacteroidales bacterium]|nr:M20/M25/M40 family metallo-hydrolase [Bacteroidales bacterium]
MISKNSFQLFRFKALSNSIGIFILIYFILIISNLNSQTYDPFIQSKVDELSYDSVYSKLQTFENLGIKQAGTEALDQTASWIINQHQQYGYSDIEIDSFYIGQNLVYNIIVTKTGTSFPDTYLIVDGHYDTYGGPGVNDNGTGTVIVLEVARLMADVETEYSIKFIHFTAEEIGLVGSYHYVENTVIPQNMDIRLVFNIDEVGGVAGEVNNTVTCERDEWTPNGNNAASAAFTDTLASLTEIYSNLYTQISYAYGSDYVPFMQNGYVVTGLYETNESPYPHSINDSLSNLDPEYVFEITKASLAASLYFGKGVNLNTDIAINQMNSDNVSIHPNPFTDYIDVNNLTGGAVEIRIYDITGRLVFNSKTNTSDQFRIFPTIRVGVYLYRVTNINGNLIGKGCLIRR